MSAALVTHRGGCHCGAVRFEVDAPAAIEAIECNCSICGMTGYQHLIVPASAFRLVAGREALACYTFNTKVAKHYFCSHCGIKSFYVPRSHPNGYSVNMRCLEPGTITSVAMSAYDGRHWEESEGSLPPLE